ncbi:hypothetical protein N4T20_15430 [Flavobacterium sp. TR2]|uniref:hypothetical protein n=1 Tax=Flavobacterium sp. TR2 TaxID=2977321 RepID=UPI0021B0E7D5|nr:hypothetical protein [Flavobacterium sp. TR2]UWY27113.1 hypothetical protein N4T20_15430 [Flavobacterium sp. TR2]
MKNDFIMSLKTILIFFGSFFLVICSLIYINVRRENRKDYRFVITQIDEDAKGMVTVSDSATEFGFANFNSYKINVQKEDSLVKRAFSKKVYIYRSDKKTDKYKLVLLLNESGMFPIDRQ